MADEMTMELLQTLLRREQALEKGDQYTLEGELDIGFKWYKLAIQCEGTARQLAGLRVN